MKGRQATAMHAAVVYMACRLEHNPRTFKEIQAGAPGTSKVGVLTLSTVSFTLGTQHAFWQNCLQSALEHVLAGRHVPRRLPCFGVCAATRPRLALYTSGGFCRVPTAPSAFCAALPGTWALTTLCAFLARCVACC